MKKSFNPLFFFFIIFEFIINVSGVCYENPDLFRPGIKVAVECSYVKSPPRSKFDSQIINSKNNFIINFECQLPDNKQCDKAKFAFENAGVILTSALLLNTPIIINATFKVFDGPIADLIGAAGPFRSIPLKDDDGIERLYPQALVKQFQFDSHPEFSPTDIVAQFNSKSPFWFEGDPPIRKNQIGFQELVLHELLHGLGFISSLGDYINPVPKIITPEIVGLQYTADGVDTKAPIKFKGFIETAFDKYMVFLSDGKSLSNTTTQISQLFTGSGDTTNFANLDAFIKAFSTTPQFKIGQRMLDTVTREKTLGFLPHDKSSVKDSVILETSIKPFQQASSISHVDYKTYTNTSEFLMTYLQESGRTLNDSITIGGNLTAGAIGPQTLSILETLGYATKQYPNPYKPSALSNSTENPTATQTVPDSSSSPSSSPSNDATPQTSSALNLINFNANLFFFMAINLLIHTLIIN